MNTHLSKVSKSIKNYSKPLDYGKNSYFIILLIKLKVKREKGTIFAETTELGNFFP
jgi:hypothetical protein